MYYYGRNTHELKHIIVCKEPFLSRIPIGEVISFEELGLNLTSDTTQTYLESFVPVCFTETLFSQGDTFTICLFTRGLHHKTHLAFSHLQWLVWMRSGLKYLLFCRHKLARSNSNTTL